MRKGERPAGDATGAMDGSLGEEWNESAKSKYRVGPTCLNGTTLGSVKMQSATEFKYLGSTL